MRGKKRKDKAGTLCGHISIAKPGTNSKLSPPYIIFHIISSRHERIIMKTKQNALTAFVRRHCANWSVPDKYCTNIDGPCCIAQGKRCRYFEESVFKICDPSYRYATETGQYETLLALYLKINPNLQQTEPEKIRLCDCGTPLKPRRRICDICQKKLRRATRRKSYHKAAS